MNFVNQLNIAVITNLYLITVKVNVLKNMPLAPTAVNIVSA